MSWCIWGLLKTAPLSAPLPELCKDTLLQTQVLVSVFFYRSSLLLDWVLQAPHGLCQFNTDLLLGPLQMDPQRLLVLELGGVGGRSTVEMKTPEGDTQSFM